MTLHSEKNQEEKVKGTLKVLLKKDIKELLPGFVMFVMAGIALCIMCLFGIFTGNGNFAVTAIYVFFYALILAFVYHVIKGANLYRKNLSDAPYLRAAAEKNLTPKRFILGKMLWTWILAAVSVAEYLAGILLMAAVAFARLPEVEEEIRKQGFFSQLEKSFGSITPLTVILACLALFLVIAAVTSMAYLAFELCFLYFIRGRYALIASLMTFFCIFWVVWKIFDFIVPVSGIFSLIGTAVYAAVICGVCVLIHLLTAAKKIYTYDN